MQPSIPKYELYLCSIIYLSFIIYIFYANYLESQKWLLLHKRNNFLTESYFDQARNPTYDNANDEWYNWKKNLNLIIFSFGGHFLLSRVIEGVFLKNGEDNKVDEDNKKYQFYRQIFQISYGFSLVTYVLGFYNHFLLILNFSFLLFITVKFKNLKLTWLCLLLSIRLYSGHIAVSSSVTGTRPF